MLFSFDRPGIGGAPGFGAAVCTVQHFFERNHIVQVPAHRGVGGERHGAAFVTLTLHHKLRGCIGTLEAHRTLGEDVTANALAAAFRDPRFKALSADELVNVKIEVSALAPVALMQWRDEDDALAQLRPGIDGVIFEYGHHHSTFLSQVWEEFPDAKTFMDKLNIQRRAAGEFLGPGGETLALYRDQAA
jgi:AmmeMemoRadiSam system protein A